MEEGFRKKMERWVGDIGMWFIEDEVQAFCTLYKVELAIGCLVICKLCEKMDEHYWLVCKY